MQPDNPFATHKEQFKNIPKDKRSQWNKKLLQIPQKKGEYKVFKQPYPDSGKWDYNGYKMHYHSYTNCQNPKGILFYFHGMNAHSQSSGYMTINIARKLDMHVYAQDFMNFGRSQGNCRGLIESQESQVEQAQKFIQFILQKYSEDKKKKIFISGLSLGGAICFKLSIKFPQKFSGILLLSPAFRQNYEAQPFMKKVGKAFAMLFPRGKIFPQSFNAQSKYDQTERILADQFIYTDKVVPGSVKVVLQTMGEIEKQYSKFTAPFILVQSGVDKLVDPFLAIDFQQQCKSSDKTVIYCKDMWHAVFGEQQIEQIVPILTEWVKARL